MKQIEKESPGSKQIFQKRLFSLIGPGFITAALVLGPGSITVSSKSGALMGYSILWVVLIAAIFMATFTRVSAKIGCLNKDSLLTIVSKTFGRWLACIIGVLSFLICSGFQTGNNVGVGLAMDALFGGGISVWAILFCVIALVFIWSSSNFYKLLEKVMAAMVLLMIISFVGNMLRVTPDLAGLLSGFIPSVPKSWGLVIAISATSFSVVGALAQSYFVQAKGWTRENMTRAKRDATAGIIILCGLSAIIIITSATVLAPKGITVTSALDMAVQLEPLLGRAAKWTFLSGLLAASFSSFIANAVLGGMLLSDGMGLGRTLNSKSVKILTTLLLIGSTIVVLMFSANPIQLIVMAQATTILGGPLFAIVLFLLANNKKVLGEFSNRHVVNVIFVLAIVWICYLSVNQVTAF